MNPDLKVLMLSASDSKGGAAKVAQYTAVGLRDRGVSVEMLVSDKQTDAEWVKQLQPPQKHQLLGKIEYRAGVNALHLATKRRYEHIFELASDDYDIVHLHDLPAGLNILDLAKILRRKNVVWTIHSMAPLTGNCLFSFGCDRWVEGCHDCPQFGTWPLIYYHRDASAWNWQARKMAYASKKQFHVVGVSDWISKQIEQSILGRHHLHTIENPSWAPDYFPVDKQQARRELGIPEDAFAIMFAVSGNHQDKRKGLDIVASALGNIQKSNPTLWEKLFLLPTGIVDPSREIGQIIDGFAGLPPRHISETKILRDYYSAADVIWHPSRADTSSMVGLEAQGCGTPMIAAAVGGVPEVVEHGVSGLLIPAEDPEALVQETAKLFSDSKLHQALKSGALKAAARKSPERFIDETLDIYRQALSND